MLVREAQLRREWCCFGSGWNVYDAASMGLARCDVELARCCVELHSAADSRWKYEKLWLVYGGRKQEKLAREELAREAGEPRQKQEEHGRLAREERRARYHARTMVTHGWR